MSGLIGKLWQNRTAAVGMVVVTLAVLVALICQWAAPYDSRVQFRDYCKHLPGATVTDVKEASAADGLKTGDRFWLGTDALGRDVLSRVLYGARISLIVGVLATLVNVVIGVLIGTLAGYFGRWFDVVLMRLTDTFFAFPGMLLAIIILATLKQLVVADPGSDGQGFDPGLLGVLIALGLTGWTGIARVIRGQVLALKEQEFIEGARAIGCGHLRIIVVHLLPNCLAPIIVLGTMQVAYNILSEAGLSFLGLGIQPPAASWGGMLADARAELDIYWWVGVFPGLALAFTVLGFNLFGDGLRDVLDPRLKARSAG